MSFTYATKASFMEPERIVAPAAWIGHIPFAFWLMEQLQPRLFVELGTHSGNSFSAFVQSAEACRLDARLVAVDHWVGDEHAGEYTTNVYEELSRYIRNRYGDRPTLLRKLFDEAVEEFDDGTIDLLHIDGLHTYEAVRHDFETWHPKLSSRAIVLFHDTTVLREGFGVHTFFQEVGSRYPSYNFLHSHGLGVLAVGKDIPAPIEALLKGQKDEQDLAPQQVFERLGNAVWDRFHARHYASVQKVEKERISKSDLERILGQLEIIHGYSEEREFLYHSYISQAENPIIGQRDVADEILSSGMFSPTFYRSLIGGASSDNDTLIKHYLEEGEKKGLSPSPDFDSVFYREKNPDVAQQGMNLLIHYIRYGKSEGREPKRIEQEISTPPAASGDTRK